MPLFLNHFRSLQKSLMLGIFAKEHKFAIKDLLQVQLMRFCFELIDKAIIAYSSGNF